MIYTFDDCRVDTARFEIARGGRALPVEPQVLELLIVLIENRDHVVTRDELLEKIWSGRVVSDTTLSSRIKTARQVIGDDGTRQRYIKTIHGRGFRFLGAVEAEPTGQAPAAKAERTAIARAAVQLSAPVPGFGGRPAIAVLPFANLSGDPDQEYFGDGLAEDILTRLAMWRWFPVIARNSSFTFRGRSVDIKDVGRELGARYVLEGSVRKAGDRVRVTGQLIDAETGQDLWAEHYDRKLDDLFAIQDDLTDGIANALEAVIGRSELERVFRKPAASLDAWDASQRGWWHAFRLTREDFSAAEPFFRRAIELDSGMAQPLSGIAWLRLFAGLFLWSPPQTAYADAVKYSQAALSLDPRDAVACTMLSAILAFSGKLNEALALGKRALALNPSSFMAFTALAATHLFRGEAKEGINAGERAIRISPDDTILHMVLGTLSANCYMAREFERAVDIAQLAVQRAPHYPIGWRSLANALGQLGRMDEGRDALARYLSLVPNYTTEAAARAPVGFRDEALFQYYMEGLRKVGWPG